ncbi:polysaccharide pyruvyl transferase family protein [Tamlana crocina]
MFSSHKIRLFWWNEVKIQGKAKENYGDLLGKYLIENISGKKVVFSWPKKFYVHDFFAPIYVTVGSILTHANHKCVVWGSGIVSKEYPIKKAKFLAVRGPQTRNHLISQGYNVPEVYGDPALLLPQYYSPKIEKKYDIGIIPHYSDFKKVKAHYQNENAVLLIDLMTKDIEETTNQILKCKKVVSSSLHGVIVAHAYGIPAVWQKFSNDVFGDDIKYQDYFESVGIAPYKPNVISSKMNTEQLLELFNGREVLPKQKKIEDICENLMRVCPFKTKL